MNDYIMVLKAMLGMFTEAIKFSAVVGFTVIIADVVYNKITKGV